MTRTAKAARLSTHLAEPFLQIHPSDADSLGLKTADLAEIQGPTGRAILRVMKTEDVSPSQVFAPMHWTGETAPAARIGAVIAAEVDPVSGQPESKASVVSVNKFKAGWYGFAVSETPIEASVAYWAKVKTETGWRMELADETNPSDWTQFAQSIFGLTIEPQILADPGSQKTRLAFFDGDRLIAALFVAPEPVAVARDFITGLVGTQAPDVLAARPGAGRADPGPTVCSCMSVGRNTLLASLQANGPDLARICQSTGAGTNCGSCRPEIQDLIDRFGHQQAAE